MKPFDLALFEDFVLFDIGLTLATSSVDFSSVRPFDDELIGTFVLLIVLLDIDCACVR